MAGSGRSPEEVGEQVRMLAVDLPRCMACSGFLQPIVLCRSVVIVPKVLCILCLVALRSRLAPADLEDERVD